MGLFKELEQTNGGIFARLEQEQAQKEPGFFASIVKPVYQTGAEFAGAINEAQETVLNKQDQKSDEALYKMQQKVLNEIRAKKVLGEDTSRLEKVLTGTLGKMGAQPIKTPDSIESAVFGKTQIYGKEGFEGVKKQAGVGAQTVALGMGPVSGGAAFFGGAAAEEGKPLLPTFEGDGFVEKGLNMFGDNVLGQAVVGAGAGKAFDLGLRGAGAVIGKTGQALKGVGGGSSALMRSATKNWERVLAPTTKLNKSLTEKAAPELAERGLFAWSRKGVSEIAETEKEIASDVLEQAWKEIPEGTKLDTEPIQSELIKALEKLHVPTQKGGVMVTSENQTAYQSLYQKLDELLRLVDDKGMADAAALRSWRQSLDQYIKTTGKTFGMTGSETAKLGATKTAANTTRGEIAKQQPQIGAANKQFVFWNNVSKIIDDTILRKTGQGSLGETIMTGAGMGGGLASGGVSKGITMAIAMKYVHRLMQTTAFQTGSAVAKKKLADAIRKGEGTLIVKAILEGFKLTGTGLEGLGKFLKGTVPTVRELQTSEAKVPEGVREYVKNPKLGLSIDDVSKNMSEDDFSVISQFIDHVRGVKKLSAEDFNAIAKEADVIAQRLGLDNAKGNASLANQLDGFVQKKLSSTLPKTANSGLTTEARKYKTAEEFVRAQTGASSQPLDVYNFRNVKSGLIGRSERSLSKLEPKEGEVLASLKDNSVERKQYQEIKQKSTDLWNKENAKGMIGMEKSNKPFATHEIEYTFESQYPQWIKDEKVFGNNQGTKEYVLPDGNRVAVLTRGQIGYGNLDFYGFAVKNKGKGAGTDVIKQLINEHFEKGGKTVSVSKSIRSADSFWKKILGTINSHGYSEEMTRSQLTDIWNQAHKTNPPNTTP
jgi:hypothetical protein